MKDFDIEKIIKEWSYRIERGYPRVEKPEDLEVLREILEENYGSDFAETYLQSIRNSLNEVALGLNNESLRHKNRHEKYIKRLIKILKKGGKVELENDVEYTDEDENNSTTVKIPDGERVKVSSQDKMIGKVVLNLKRMLKYGPNFPEDDEDAQSALEQVEEFFTYDDGTYRRVIPVKVKDRKVLLKLNDISKNTVTREEDEEETNNPELKKKKKKKAKAKMKKKDKKKKKAKAKMKKKNSGDSDETDDLSLDLGEEEIKESEEGENPNNRSDFSLPEGVIEFFGDTYKDGDGINHATGEDLTGDEIGDSEVNEDSEDEGENEGEGHTDDAPSKYVDRRKDGKDTKYPDREYREFDPESDSEEEEKDDDYRQGPDGDEEETAEEEAEDEAEEEAAEEEETANQEGGGEEGGEEQVEESYKFSFKL